MTNRIWLAPGAMGSQSSADIGKLQWVNRGRSQRERTHRCFLRVIRQGVVLVEAAFLGVAAQAQLDRHIDGGLNTDLLFELNEGGVWRMRESFFKSHAW